MLLDKLEFVEEASYEKILFGLVLVLFGIFSLSFEAYMGDGLWSIFNFSPFIGVGFGIWGLLEKDK